MKRILIVCVVLILCPLWIAAGDCKKFTSGPNPPLHMDMGLKEISKSQVIIPGVPSYIWQHGAIPTSIGMVLGYYDGKDCPDLVDGDASTQTMGVNNMIAGDNDNTACGAAFADHYHDYACPIDNPNAILPDKSSTGGAHSSNCLADFTKTSWSASNLSYGETSVW